MRHDIKKGSKYEGCNKYYLSVALVTVTQRKCANFLLDIMRQVRQVNKVDIACSVRNLFSLSYLTFIKGFVKSLWDS